MDSFADPADFGGPDMVLWISEKRDFQRIPESIPGVEGFPN